MGCNAASLMAGGGALYLDFATGTMQNIIQSLYYQWRCIYKLELVANTLQPL